MGLHSRGSYLSSFPLLFTGYPFPWRSVVISFKWPHSSVLISRSVVPASYAPLGIVLIVSLSLGFCIYYLRFLYSDIKISITGRGADYDGGLFHMHFPVVATFDIKMEGIYFFYDFPVLRFPLLYIFLVL